MYTAIGSCPVCGSPIYTHTTWNAITPPPSIRSCGCPNTVAPFATKQSGTAVVTPQQALDQAAFEENAARIVEAAKRQAERLASKTQEESDDPTLYKRSTCPACSDCDCEPDATLEDRVAHIEEQLEELINLIKKPQKILKD